MFSFENHEQKIVKIISNSRIQSSFKKFELGIKKHKKKEAKSTKKHECITKTRILTKTMNSARICITEKNNK